MLLNTFFTIYYIILYYIIYYIIYIYVIQGLWLKAGDGCVESALGWFPPATHTGQLQCAVLRQLFFQWVIKYN